MVGGHQPTQILTGDLNKSVLVVGGCLQLSMFLIGLGHLLCNPKHNYIH